MNHNLFTRLPNVQSLTMDYIVFTWMTMVKAKRAAMMVTPVVRMSPAKIPSPPPTLALRPLEPNKKHGKSFTV